MLHIWLWVGGLRTWGRYGILVWNIGGDRRHTPTIVPTTHQIHYPVTTKNTFRKGLNVKIVHAEQGAFCPPKNFLGTFSPWHPFFTVVQSPNIVSLGVCDIFSLVCVDWKIGDNQWWSLIPQLTSVSAHLPWWPALLPDWWISPDLTRICCPHRGKSRKGSKKAFVFYTGERANNWPKQRSDYFAQQKNMFWNSAPQHLLWKKC